MSMDVITQGEMYEHAARQFVTERHRWRIQWHEHIGEEPHFVVPGTDEDTVAEEYSISEFVGGSMFWHLDDRLPAYVHNQQVAALTHAVRAEIERRELGNMLQAVVVNYNALVGSES